MALALRPTILLLFLLLLGTSTILAALPQTVEDMYDDVDGILESSCTYNQIDSETEAGGDRRLLLASRRRFLSYNMLKRNSVPCSRRGVSYYNCNRHGKVNPYHRGCSFITRCARDLH